MHKKIGGLYFIIASSFTFSMEQAPGTLGYTVTLGYISNNSNAVYTAKYGPGHTTLLYSKEGCNLNQPLFCLRLDQHSPIDTEKIVFNELLPEGWSSCPELVRQRMRALTLTIAEKCLLNIKYSVLKIQSPTKEKDHVLEPDEKYVLEVGIDHKHNLFWDLTKLYQRKKK